MATYNDTWGSWTSSASSASTTTDTWTTWTSDATSSGADFDGTSDTVWHTWTSDSGTTSSLDATDSTWITWTQRVGSVKVPTRKPLSLSDYRYNIRTHESIQAQLRRNNQTKIQQLWREYVREEAELTAMDLLEDLLDENQIEVYKETGRVLVKGRKHDYIVRRHGTTIKQLEKDKVQDLCCHLGYPHKNKMPETDDTIAKILAIKLEEKRFNKLANAGRPYTMKDLPEAAKAANF